MTRFYVTKFDMGKKWFAKQSNRQPISIIWSMAESDATLWNGTETDELKRRYPSAISQPVKCSNGPCMSVASNAFVFRGKEENEPEFMAHIRRFED